MLKYQDGKFILLDVGSAGGTKVNDQRVAGKALKAGGVIKVGQSQFTLVEVEAGESAQVATSSGATMVEQPESGGAVLVVQSGPDAGKSFPLVQGENAIGRYPGCQILVTDPSISRLHTMVRRDRENCFVYDLGSRTGTQVDGKTVSGHPLASGDVIAMGRSEIILMQVEQPKG